MGSKMQIIYKEDFSQRLSIYTKFPMIEIWMSDDGSKLMFKERFIIYKLKTYEIPLVWGNEEEISKEQNERWIYLNEYEAGRAKNDKENVRILSNFWIFSLKTEDYVVKNGKIRRINLKNSFNKLMKKLTKMISILHNYSMKRCPYGILRIAPTDDNIKDCYNFVESWIKEKYPFLKDYFSLSDLNYNFANRKVSKIERGIKLFENSKKEIKRIITKECDNFYCGIENLRIINYVGIKDINVIASILKNNGYHFGYTPMNILEIKPGACRYYLKLLKKNYSNINCDALLLKRFSNGDGVIAADTMRFLATYKYIKPKTSIVNYSEKEISETSIKELHDKLYHAVRDEVNLYRNPELKNEIELNDLNNKLNNVTIDNYKFIVPIKYSEFVDLGNTMYNCVATYYKAAFKHMTNIVYGIEKGSNKPDICIEINNNLRVVQCYGIGNRRLTKEKEEIALKYFETVGANKKAYPEENFDEGHLNDLMNMDRNNILGILEELPF